jgi:K(+)-stimulated pyrophosphate-energized sodium pump
MMVMAGLLLIGLLAFPTAKAALAGEEADRSMVTTESGDTEYFLDMKEGSWFIIDMISDSERTMDVKLYVVNPETDTSHEVEIELLVPENEDWEFRIKEILDESGDDISGKSEIQEGTLYNVRDLDGGSQVTVILEATYLGDDNDDEIEVTLTAALDGNQFSSSKTLTFKTYEGNFILIIITLVIALLGLGFAFLTARAIMKKEVGSEKLKELSGFIRDGATAFLNAEYKVIIFFIVGVVVFFIFGIFLLDMNWMLIPAFLLGALFSASAGNIGMRIATMANAKTAWACKSGKKSGLKVAFNSGSVMGLTVVGLGLLGLTVLYIVFGDVEMLFGFGFGASSIALFARVGGGIYTKAADVGADLVGKVEAGIPEDDPRNPATIADNVGDNVGDVAGMGADLFESYVDSIIAAMALGIMGVSALGSGLVGGGSAGAATLLPMILAGVGIICAILGTFAVSAGGESADAHKQLNRGIWVAAALMTLSSLALIYFFFKDESNSTQIIISLFVSLITGLAAGIVIGKVTEYYTSDSSKPTQKVSEASTTGAGPNIIAGLGLGMISTAVPVLAVVVTIIVAFMLSGLYGIALAAVGMLSTLGITLATDTYGPVADNAAGLAEMAEGKVSLSAPLV